jgi:hypothetical protein
MQAAMCRATSALCLTASRSFAAPRAAALRGPSPSAVAARARGGRTFFASAAAEQVRASGFQEFG